MKQKSRDFINFKEGQPPVKPEAYGGQHTEDHHHAMGGRITGDVPFHHHQLI